MSELDPPQHLTREGRKAWYATKDLRDARWAVEQWLAQWGIHNDAEIGALLDELVRSAQSAVPWGPNRDSP